MNIYIIIPAYNEEATIGLMLDSLSKQTFRPKKVVVVNDNSSDKTQQVAEGCAKQHDWLTVLNHTSYKEHSPGTKVINAFYKGYETLDENYDIICKFDADIILPNNYLESIVTLFKSEKKIGIAGGLAFIKKGDAWVYEKVADKNHVRGPFKAYKKQCFKEIGGLKKSIGWDTVDVLLAKYHGWIVKTDQNLIVKHLKPTGNTYTYKSKHLQGEAFYKMRYGIKITVIAALKSAIKKKSISYFINTVSGYLKARNENTEPIVTLEEGEFIRKLRWQGIKQKLGLS